MKLSAQTALIGVPAQRKVEPLFHKLLPHNDMQQQLSMFEKSLQKTNGILKAIEERFMWSDRHKAYLAFRAVMHTLRDRLPVESAASLAAQLPLVLKGVFYDGWKPGDKPMKMHAAEFADAVHEKLHPPYGIEFDTTPSFEQSPEEIIQGILAVVESYTDPAEVQKIKKLLPKDIMNMLAQGRAV